MSSLTKEQMSSCLDVAYAGCSAGGRGATADCMMVASDACATAIEKTLANAVSPPCPSYDASGSQATNAKYVFALAAFAVGYVVAKVI